MPEVQIPVIKSEEPGFSFSHPEHMLRVLQAYCEDAKLPWIVLQNQIQQLVEALYKDGWALSKIRGANLGRAREAFLQNKNVDVFVNLKAETPASHGTAEGPKPSIS